MRNFKIILERIAKEILCQFALFTNAILPLTFTICPSQKYEIAKLVGFVVTRFSFSVYIE